MPRDITVTFDDGSQHIYKGAPDDVTPEQAAARAQQEFGKKVTALDGGEKGASNGLARQAKLFGSNVLQGIAGLPALVLDVGTALRETVSPSALAARALGQPKTYDLSRDFGHYSSGVAGGAEELFGVKPETQNEKLAAAITQGAAGGFASGGAAPVRSMVAGAGSGAGAEMAGRLFGDNALVKLLGGLAGGLGAGGVANFFAGTKPQVKALANEALEGIDESMLQKAQAFQAQAKAKGVDMDLAQALEAVGVPASNLTTIRNILANSKAGTKTQQVLRGQPGQLKEMAELEVLGMPGNVKGPGDAANAVQEAATQTVNNAKLARSKAVQPLYEAAGDLGADTVAKVRAAVQDIINQPGATDGTKAAGRELLRKLDSVPGALRDRVTAAEQVLAGINHGNLTGKLDRDPKFIMDRIRAREELNAAQKAVEGASKTPIKALDLDTAITDAVGPFKGTPLSPPDPKTAGQLKHLAGRVNEILHSGSAELKQAEAKFKAITEAEINPLKQGITGQLATPRGYKPDVQASAAKLETLFSTGTDPRAGGRSDILTLAKELKAVDKEAFPNAAKTFISGRLAKAFGPEFQNTGETSAKAAENVWNQLFSNARQFQGMKDMAAGIADSYGLPRQDVVRGVENLAQITKALKSRPDTVGGLQAKEIFELSGGNYASNAARVFGFLPFERVARKLEDRVMNQTFGKFDEILTSPEGAQLLAKLGRVKPMSEEAFVLLSGFGQAAVQANKE